MKEPPEEVSMFTYKSDTRFACIEGPVTQSRGAVYEFTPLLKRPNRVRDLCPQIGGVYHWCGSLPEHRIAYPMTIMRGAVGFRAHDGKLPEFHPRITIPRGDR